MRQFWERGYRATSVDDLVRATGVKPGSLYSAFPGGKHALLMGSLDRYSRLVVPQKLGDLGKPGASVAQIRAYFDGLVRATGVKPGSLYSAFPGGKHALLMGSLDRYSRLVVPQKLGDLEEPGASVAQIRAYFDGLVHDLMSPEGRQGCLLINSAIENAAVDPEVAAVVRGHMARLERCFTGALRTAVDLGEIPASVSVTAIAKGLLATASGLMVIGKADPDEEVLRIIVDNAFAGLK